MMQIMEWDKIAAVEKSTQFASAIADFQDFYW